MQGLGVVGLFGLLVLGRTAPWSRFREGAAAGIKSEGLAAPRRAGFPPPGGLPPGPNPGGMARMRPRVALALYPGRDVQRQVLAGRRPDDSLR